MIAGPFTAFGVPYTNVSVTYEYAPGFSELQPGHFHTRKVFSTGEAVVSTTGAVRVSRSSKSKKRPVKRPSMAASPLK